MLALDFDGVICDALDECAAVTWFAAIRAADPTPPPRLPEALDRVPPAFLEVFRSVRGYARTLADFMVANTLAEPVTSHAGFDRAKQAAGPELLTRQAAAGEAIRAQWRSDQFTEWITLHTVYPGVTELITDFEGTIAIVSAKDTASINEILAFHRLGARVTTVIGSCHDKPAALTRLLAENPAERRRAVFIDDNLGNILDAAALPIATLWATWGYHTPEDLDTAHGRAITSATLDTVHDLVLTRGHHTTTSERQYQ